jgi:hypothetical protein
MVEPRHWVAGAGVIDRRIEKLGQAPRIYRLSRDSAERGSEASPIFRSALLQTVWALKPAAVLRLIGRSGHQAGPRHDLAETGRITMKAGLSLFFASRCVGDLRCKIGF